MRGGLEWLANHGQVQPGLWIPLHSDSDSAEVGWEISDYCVSIVEDLHVMCMGKNVNGAF